MCPPSSASRKMHVVFDRCCNSSMLSACCLSQSSMPEPSQHAGSLLPSGYDTFIHPFQGLFLRVRSCIHVRGACLDILSPGARVHKTNIQKVMYGDGPRVHIADYTLLLTSLLYRRLCGSLLESWCSPGGPSAAQPFNGQPQSSAIKSIAA